MSLSLSHPTNKEYPLIVDWRILGGTERGTGFVDLNQIVFIEHVVSTGFGSLKHSVVNYFFLG